MFTNIFRMQYTSLCNGDTFAGIKIKSDPTSSWPATALFHQDSTRGDCWTHGHCSGLRLPCSCSSRNAYLDGERGMSGYRIGMQAAHRRALRYDAHVVYLRHCALIHVAIWRHNFERTANAASILQNQRMSTCNIENYKSRGLHSKLSLYYSILF